MTKLITSAQIGEAAACIRDGGTVVFPTETVYGLGADACNDAAVEKIFAAKGRPADNPLIVHIAEKSDICKLARTVSPEAQTLMDVFWPGPLTLVYPKTGMVGTLVTAGLPTVAVRMPSNEIARALIAQSGCFIAAPSANRSGSPSPTVLRHVAADLDGRVDYIIDGGSCEIGLESTVVDVSGDAPELLRPGKISPEELRAYVPDLKISAGILQEVARPKCPGMKYTHYSPKADVIVVEGQPDAVHAYIAAHVTAKDGVLAYRGGTYDTAKLVIDAGADMTAYAEGLFYNLRVFDEQGAATIYAAFTQEPGIGLAVKNRLYKAAGHHVIHV